MSIRIYALAKELSLDSKELVGICTKAGVTGKGSALASLTDEEVESVKKYLDSSRAPAPPTSRKDSASGKPVKPPAPQDRGIKTLASVKAEAESRKRGILSTPLSSRVRGGKPPAQRAAPEPSAPEPSVAESVAADVSEPLTVADSPPASEAVETPAAPPSVTPTSPPPPTASPPTASPPTASPPTAAPVAASTPAPSQAAPRRSYQPLAGRGSIKVLDSGRGKADETGADESRPARPQKKRGPVIKLAAMPKVKQPAATAVANEPKAQKPIMPLSQDTIRSVKSGEPAPLDHLTRGTKKGPEKGAGGPQRYGENAGDAGKGKGKGGKTQVGGNLAGMSGGRTVRKSSRGGRSSGRHRDDDTHRRRRRLVRKNRNVSTAAPRKGNIPLQMPCTIRGFSEATGVPTAQVLRVLMGLGVASLNINAQLDEENVTVLAAEFELAIDIKEEASLEDSMLAQFEDIVDPPESLQPRPPVVTFLGHVDHGKTSLLDHIIETKVVDGEAGGITQHIRAYAIERDGRAISFVDTPGHEAFTEMRARGANVTDIAVLVIAADDGIMPQTEEAISHAKAAEVPILIALNKMDLPGADPDKVFQQLAAHELLPSEWGGDTEVVRTSAITGEGMDELLETILGIAELNEYAANPDRAAAGVCLEAEQDGGRGVVAKLIVQKGTLHPGDVIVCGGAYGRVKAMYDTLGRNVRKEAAGPSIPVNVTGLNVAPGAGDAFHVMQDISKAREIAETRSDRSRSASLAGQTTRISFDDFQAQLAEGRLQRAGEDIVNLNLIIRADVQGSIEALEKEMQKLDHPEVRIKVLQRSVGGITSADVTLAHASQAVIIGFNVIPDDTARSLADERGVEIRRYSIIYKITEDLRALLEGKLKPEIREVDLGRAIVKRVFSVSRSGSIAGCYVSHGAIERGCRIRINREGRTIGEYPLDSLRREKDDVKEVPRGMECGVKLSGFNDIKAGDVLEAFKIEEVARTL